MENEQTTKPNSGTWDRLGKNDDVTRLPRISFEINLPQQVTFLEDTPKEIPSRDDPTSVFYVFSVSQGGIEKEIATSAWTLLSALKQLSPLKDKEVSIVKKLVKGKQNFEVTLLTK